MPALVLLADCASARENLSLTNAWRLKKSDQTSAAATELMDVGWQAVSFPHLRGWRFAPAQVKCRAESIMKIICLLSAVVGLYAFAAHGQTIDPWKNLISGVMDVGRAKFASFQNSTPDLIHAR